MSDSDKSNLNGLYDFVILRDDFENSCIRILKGDLKDSIVKINSVSIKNLYNEIDEKVLEFDYNFKRRTADMPFSEEKKIIGDIIVDIIENHHLGD